MKERISALMDGEWNQAELGRDLKLLSSEGEWQQLWATYHLIGDALRGRSVSWYADKVSARLAEEPPREPEESVTFSLQRAGLLVMSVAAGIAAVVLVGWMALPQNKQQLPQAALPQIASAPAVKTVKSSVPPAAPAADETVDDYLLAHQRFSPAGAMQGVATYVRTGTHEGEK